MLASQMTDLCGILKKAIINWFWYSEESYSFLAFCYCQLLQCSLCSLLLFPELNLHQVDQRLPNNMMPAEYTEIVTDSV